MLPRQLLIKEINEVIDFSGNYVNYRHIPYYVIL